MTKTRQAELEVIKEITAALMYWHASEPKPKPASGCTNLVDWLRIAFHVFRPVYLFTPLAVCPDIGRRRVPGAWLHWRVVHIFVFGIRVARLVSDDIEITYDQQPRQPRPARIRLRRGAKHR